MKPQPAILIDCFEPFIVDKRGALLYRDHHGKFIEEISPFFTKVFVLSDKVEYDDQNIPLAVKRQYFDGNHEPTFYHHVFKNKNIIPIVSRSSYGGITKISNYIQLLHKLFLLIKVTSRCNYVYVYSPSVRVLPLVLLKRIFKYSLILYVANEWNKSAEFYTDNRIKMYIVNKLLKFLEHLSVKYSDYIFTTSNGLLSAYLLKKRNHNVFKVVPLILFDKHDIATPRPIQKNPIRLLIVSTNIKCKRTMDILVALHLLRSRAVMCTMTSVGSMEGSYAESLRAYVRDNRLEECVSFKGAIGDPKVLRQLYLTHDVFILPSEMEGFPKVVIEAMIHRELVIVSDIPSYDGIDGGAIYRYPMGDTNKLAEIINDIFAEEVDVLQKRCDSAIEYISQILHQTTAEQLIAALNLGKRHDDAL